MVAIKLPETDQKGRLRRKCGYADKFTVEWTVFTFTPFLPDASPWLRLPHTRTSPPDSHHCISTSSVCHAFVCVCVFLYDIWPGSSSLVSPVLSHGPTLSLVTTKNNCDNIPSLFSIYWVRLQIMLSLYFNVAAKNGGRLNDEVVIK